MDFEVHKIIIKIIEKMQNDLQWYIWYSMRDY